MDQVRTPQDLARDTADTAKALRCRTEHPEAFHVQDEGGVFISAAPSNVSATVSGLTSLLDELPLVVQNTARALQNLEEQQAIRMSGGGAPSEPVSAVLRALLNAEQALNVAHAHLREAGGPLSNMGGHFVGDDELEDADATR